MISQDIRMVGNASHWLIANLGVVAVLYTSHCDLFAYHLQTGLLSTLAGVGGVVTHLTHVWVCSASRV